MHWDVLTVKPQGPLTLAIGFSDGLKGFVRFLPEHLIGVFSPLNQADFFKQVYVEDGVVTWPGEIDLAPDAMYEAILTKGEWVLG